MGPSAAKQAVKWVSCEVVPSLYTYLIRSGPITGGTRPMPPLHGWCCLLLWVVPAAGQSVQGFAPAGCVSPRGIDMLLGTWARLLSQGVVLGHDIVMGLAGAYTASWMAATTHACHPSLSLGCG